MLFRFLISFPRLLMKMAVCVSRLAPSLRDECGAGFTHVARLLSLFVRRMASGGDGLLTSSGSKVYRVGEMVELGVGRGSLRL